MRKLLQLTQSVFVHKKALLLILVFACVFTLIPLTTEAGLFGTIKGAIVDAILAAINAILAFFTLIVKFIFTAIATIALTVIKYVVGMGVAPGASTTPLFVKDAWNFVRQFVNIFFILILVFIGLATILRLQNYQLQKTLPLLIIMALLVNFSGVFVGFIVDMSNLVTMFFLGKAAEPNWGDIASTFKPGQEVVSQIATNIAFIIFFLVASLIYIVVILVFVVRTMFLWVLAILAPLAFASYILPATKGKIWDEWLKQFIQWSIFGIPVAFFLWLAQTVLGAGQMGGIGEAPSNVSVLAKLLAPFTALFILFYGVMKSQEMAPAAAKAVADFGKKVGVAGAMGLGSAVARRVPLGKFGENMRKRGQGIEVVEAEKTRLERWGGTVLGKIPGMGRLGSAINVPLLEKRRDTVQARVDELEAKKRKNRGKLGKADTGELEQKKNELQNVNTEISTASAGAATQGMARFVRRGATLFGGGIELAGKELDTRTGAKDEREVAQGTKDVGNKDSFQVFNMINEEGKKGRLANWNRVVGMLNGVRNRGDGDDIEDALKSGQLNKNIIGGVIKHGQRVGPPGFRPLLKSFYGNIYADSRAYGFDADVDENGNVIEGSGRDAKFLADQKRSLPSKFNAQDFQGDTIAPQNFNTNTKEGRLFLEMIVKGRGADFMSQLGRRPRKEESRTIMEYIFKEGRHAQTGLGTNWLLDNNAEDVLRYLDSPGARSLGLGRNITRQRIEELIEEKRAGKTTEDLLEQKVRLEQELADLKVVINPTQRERRRLSSINTIIQQIESTLNRMDENATPTQDLLNDVIRLQNDIAQATQEIEKDETNLQAYRDQARAEKELGPLQQEVRRRGVPIPTTPQEKNYGTLLGREQTLRGRILIVEASLKTPMNPAQHRSQQDLLHYLQQELAQTETAMGRIEIELGKVPEPPAPLPKIQPDMPDSLKELISQGNREIQTIGEKTKEMQDSFVRIRESQEDLTEVTQTTARLRKELRDLQAQVQAGTLTSELRTRIPELEGKIQELLKTERNLDKQIETYRNKTTTIREQLLRSKQNVDGPNAPGRGIRKRIAAQTEPLQRRYERTQRSEQREQRLKQRKDRRKKR